MPASAAGAVAPAWPADSSSTGMPPRTAASRQRQASSAKRSGGTTKQLDRRDERPRPPRRLAAGDRCRMSSASSTCSPRRSWCRHAWWCRQGRHRRVEVELERDRPCRARTSGALEEVDVLERVDDAGGVVEVLQQRLAVVAGSPGRPCARPPRRCRSRPSLPHGSRSCRGSLAARAGSAGRPRRPRPRPGRAGRRSRPCSFTRRRPRCTPRSQEGSGCASPIAPARRARPRGSG